MQKHATFVYARHDFKQLKNYTDCDDRNELRRFCFKKKKFKTFKHVERSIVVIADIHDTGDISNAVFNKSTRRTAQTTSDHTFDIAFVRLNQVTLYIQDGRKPTSVISHLL